MSCGNFTRLARFLGVFILGISLMHNVNARIRPTFVPTPENITVVEGGTAVLPCSIQHLGTKSVIWRKDSQHNPITIGLHAFTSDPRFAVTHTRDNVNETSQWNLQIRDVRGEDSGNYRCQITSANVKSVNRVKLFVNEKVVKSDTEKGIRIDGDTFVELGDTVELRCTSGRRRHHIEWYRDSRRMQPDERIIVRTHRSISTGEIISYVFIRASRIEDNGVYTCKDGLHIASTRVVILNTDSHGRRGAGIDSDSTSPPSTTTTTTTTTTTSSTATTTPTTSNPTTSPTASNPTTTPTTSTTTTTNSIPVTTPDTKRYTKWQILAPKFLSTPESITVAIGGTAVLPCSIQHLGTKSVVWRKDSQPNPITIGGYAFTDDPRFAVTHTHNKENETSQWDLQIRDVRSEDSGTYECQIPSKNNDYVNRVKLIVNEPVAHAHIVGEHLVTLGDTVKLRCITQSYSNMFGSFDWFKDGNRLESNAHVDVTLARTSKVIYSELLIKTSRLEDAGTYVCRVNTGSEVMLDSIDVVILTRTVPNKKRGNDDEGGDDNGGGGNDGHSNCTMKDPRTCVPVPATSSQTSSVDSIENACDMEHVMKCVPQIDLTGADVAELCRVVNETKTCFSAIHPNCDESHRGIIQQTLSHFDSFQMMCTTEEEEEKEEEKEKEEEEEEEKEEEKEKEEELESTCTHEDVQKCIPSREMQQDVSQFCRMMKETKDCYDVILPNCDAPTRATIEHALSQFEHFKSMCITQGRETEIVEESLLSTCTFDDVQKCMPPRRTKRDDSQICQTIEKSKKCFDVMLANCDASMRSTIEHSMPYFERLNYMCSIVRQETEHAKGSLLSTCTFDNIQKCVSSSKTVPTTESEMCRVIDETETCLSAILPNCDDSMKSFVEMNLERARSFC